MRNLDWKAVEARYEDARNAPALRGLVQEEWAGELKPDEPVVVFCAYGFHVGCRTAQALRSRGFDARYMAGGHSAWKAIGGELEMHA